MRRPKHESTPGSGTTAQAHAVRVLTQVITHGRALDEVLRDAEPWPPGVSAGLVKETCYGVLRWRWRLDAILKALLEHPLRDRESEVGLLLWVGLYQLTSLRMPHHVVVSSCVHAAREIGKPWATGLTNGILRNFLREREHLERAVQNGSDEAKWSSPDWLVTLVKRDWPEAWEVILDVSNQRPPMSLRVNRRHLTRDEYLSRLAQANIAATRLPLCDDGILLERPCSVAYLPGFQEGWVSIQDGGAQLAVDILAPQAGDRVLDACAAPGGKSCHILERYGSDVQLHALDNDARRMEKLSENLQRLGLSAHIKVADAGEPSNWWDGIPFQRILLDVPCSASGVIRRHPDIKTLRRASDMDVLIANQKRLITGVWPALASGGILVYTTCSVFRGENSAVLQSFMSQHNDARICPIDMPIGQSDDCGIQIIPGDAGMDGFYYSALIKT